MGHPAPKNMATPMDRGCKTESAAECPMGVPMPSEQESRGASTARRCVATSGAYRLCGRGFRGRDGLAVKMAESGCEIMVLADILRGMKAGVPKRVPIG